MAIATQRPPIHVVGYSDSGGGKSTFAAGFPKPLLVCLFDPVGKDTPYQYDVVRQRPRGIITDLGTTEWGAPYYDVLSAKDDRLLIRVERYHNADAEDNADAYRRFLSRMAAFGAEYAAWSTIVIDSVTFMELASRMYHQFVLNPKAKEPRQWWGGATDDLERMLMIRCGSLPMNVVVLCHVDEDKDELHGTFVRSPKAPGRLRKGLAAGFGELYRAYVQRDAQRNATYWLQTRSDALFSAASQIGAPDPCPTSYAALWSAS